MSSGRSHVSRGRSTRASCESTPPSFGVRAEALFGGSRRLRSSGKRPLTAEEADRFEALSRKRRSLKVKSSKFEPVTTSDEKKGDRDRPCFQIQPLATIALGQECVNPDPNTVEGVLQRLENALKQAISAIDTWSGLYADVRPFLRSCLEDVRRVGGVQLALRCDRKLFYWDRLALHAQRLAYSDLRIEVWRLMGKSRFKIERDHRAQCILEQEAIARGLCEQQHRLQHAIADYSSTTAYAGDRLFLEDMERESADVHRAFLKTMRTLHELWYEDDISDTGLFSEKLEEEATAQVEATRAKELSELKAELRSFTVLDCA